MVDLLNQEYGFVYAIQSLHLVKIGVAKDIEKRLTAMRLHNPHGCELVFYRRTYAPYTFEKRMHELLADKAVGREWFSASLTEIRAAANTARLDCIRAERASKALFEAAKKKPRKLTQRADTVDNQLKRFQALSAQSNLP